MKRYLILALYILLPGISSLKAETIKVNSISSLQQTINNTRPGDLIIVENGRYTTTEGIIVKSTGMAGKPVTIQSESAGGVEISGTNGFNISSPSSYVIIKGFKFTHNTGTISVAAGVTHCVFTGNLFECAPVNTGSKPYLNISGDDNEVSFNTFQNKKDEGQMISVQGPGGDRMAKRTWIHHNYFYNFPPTANNCSAIQIGLSGRSMDSAFCIVEYNLFLRTEGENEGAI